MISAKKKVWMKHKAGWFCHSNALYWDNTWSFTPQFWKTNCRSKTGPNVGISHPRPKGLAFDVNKSGWNVWLRHPADDWQGETEGVFSDRGAGETRRQGGRTQVSCKPLKPIHLLTFAGVWSCDLTIGRRRRLPLRIKHQDSAGCAAIKRPEGKMFTLTFQFTDTNSRGGAWRLTESSSKHACAKDNTTGTRASKCALSGTCWHKMVLTLMTENPHV